MRPRRLPTLRPRRAGAWEREREVETIAREAAPGWRERVFTYLFDPSWSVRNEASEWLLDEPALNRAEHAFVLRDREWAVRYNAASRRLADPEVKSVPDWVPDLFSQALARERDAIVARQIMRVLARHAPDRFPLTLPSHIRENDGYARAGFGLGLLRTGQARGGEVLRAMLDEDRFYRGTTFALNVLIGPENEAIRGSAIESTQGYLVALRDWLDGHDELVSSRERVESTIARLSRIQTG